MFIDLASTETSNMNNLQAQINALNGRFNSAGNSVTNVNNAPIGPDTIISKI